MSKIAVIGTGYVGLTTGACFAHLGHDVVCADIDADKVERLSRGEVPILEPRLDELVREGLAAGRLSFVVGAANGARDAEFAYLCVPTPQSPDGSADLSFIEGAAREIAPVLPDEAVVVNKSTVPVGSTRAVERVMKRPDVRVVSNPEFLREGWAVHDFLNPDRIVIGSEDQAAAIKVSSLYLRVQAPTIVTDPATAETIKYASNAFLATKISFINAMTAVCEAVGADINDVVLGMGYDKRIGFEFLKPGPGWGGSCLVGDETVLVERDGAIRLLSMEALFAEVERVGAEGWRVAAWRPDEPTPELLPVVTFSARPHVGEVVEVRTKMGRRVVVTPDHPFVVGDGVSAERPAVKLAAELTAQDWLPVAQGFPTVSDACPRQVLLLDTLEAGGLGDGAVIVRLCDEQRRLARERDRLLPGPRRWDARRAGTLRLRELRLLGLDAQGGLCGTTTNGTYVPAVIDLDERFWRVVGLFLAEGHITQDGNRQRIAWSFHRTDEMDIVEEVASYWRELGVKVTVRQLATTCQVSISSRVLSAWLEHGLGVGRNCYDKRIPDLAWALPEREKWALLRGLWDGDGSWSLVNGGPSVVLEYGTVSRPLADGMLRLLGDLGVTARLKVGRTPKSTCDTYWLTIAGADQIDSAMPLLPPIERLEVKRSMYRQAKRIAPTGYRRLSKNASWVRVTGTERRPYQGTVYSLEVPGAETIVATHGLVVHNCFPKDSRALIHSAETRGYQFDMLRSVVQVNDQQFDRVVEKIDGAVDGKLEGATVAAWGLTFKANTDDIRESPALEIIGRLRARGAKVQAYDPAVASTRTAPELEGISVHDDPFAACQGAHVLAVLTEWDEFRFVDLDKVREAMAGAAVVDARNLLDRTALQRRGFTYDGLGRV